MVSKVAEKENGSKGLETSGLALSLLVWPGGVTVTEQALPHCHWSERDSWRIMVVNLLFEDDSRSGPVG